VSALGQKQTFAVQKRMSALPRKRTLIFLPVQETPTVQTSQGVEGASHAVQMQRARGSHHPAGGFNGADHAVGFRAGRSDWMAHARLALIRGDAHRRRDEDRGTRRRSV
jgi:hypothetical protein